MNDAIRQHVVKYPHARTSTVRYLVAREAMTKRLQQEIEAKKPKVSWLRRLLGRL